MAVKKVKLNSANYTYDNSNSLDRDFEITANVQVNNGTELASCDNGEVKDPISKELLCSFNAYQTNSINYSFYNAPVSKQISIISAITTFVQEVSADVAENN